MRRVQVSEKMQQGRSGGEGTVTGYRGDNTSQKKSRGTVNLHPAVQGLSS